MEGLIESSACFTAVITHIMSFWMKLRLFCTCVKRYQIPLEGIPTPFTITGCNFFSLLYSLNVREVLL